MSMETNIFEVQHSDQKKKGEVFQSTTWIWLSSSADSNIKHRKKLANHCFKEKWWVQICSKLLKEYMLKKHGLLNRTRAKPAQFDYKNQFSF